MLKNLVVLLAVMALSSIPLMAQPPGLSQPKARPRPPAVVLPIPTVFGVVFVPLPGQVVRTVAQFTSVDLSAGGPVQEVPIWPYTSVVSLPR
jgi:hypothetical protein